MTRPKIPQESSGTTRQLVSFRWATPGRRARFETIGAKPGSRWLLCGPEDMLRFVQDGAASRQKDVGARELETFAGRTYDPREIREEMRFSAMHVELARTETSEQGVLSFVERFGRLGLGELLLESDNARPDEAKCGESPDLWTDCIEIMRVAVALVWLDDSWVKRQSNGRASRRDGELSDKTRGKLARQWLGLIPIHGTFRRKEGSLGVPHCHFYDLNTRSFKFSNGEQSLRFWCDESLEDLKARRQYLAFLFDEFVGSACAVRLVDGTQGKRLALAPSTLWHYLWIDLAQSLESDQAHYVCLACGGAFSVGASRSRGDRLFCCAACKQANLEYRRAEVRRLVAEDPELSIDQLVQLAYDPSQLDEVFKRARAREMVKKWTSPPSSV